MKIITKLLACLLLLMFSMFQVSTVVAQCTNAAAFGSGVAPTGSTPVTLTTCAFTGEYSTISSVVAGNRYVITATGGLPNLYITVRFSTPSGNVVAAGISPLQFTAPCSGTYYSHYANNPACATGGAGCVTATIACSSCGASANQCTNGSAFGSVTAPVAGTSTISTCSFQSEYSTLNSVAANTVYSNTVSVAGSFITIHQGSPSGPVIASGVTPLIWTSTTAGTYYAHWNTNASCGLASTCVTTTMGFVMSNPCGGGPAGCTNSAAFGSGTLSGNNQIITLTTCAFAGEYSTIFGAVSGQTLVFTATASYSPVYLTVHSGTFNGPIIAAGNSPLTVANTFTGTLFLHYNTNSSCGTLSTCHTGTVQCTSCPPPSAPNDLCANAITIPCGGTVTGNTSGAGTDATACASFASPGIWYSFTATITGAATVSLCGSSYDTWASAYNACGGTCLASNDDFCGLQSQITFPIVNGNVYKILVNGFSTSSGAFTMSLTCAAAFDPCAVITPSNACGVSNTTVIASGSGAWTNGPFAPPGREAVYTFTPTTTGNYTITQISSTTGTWTDYFYKPVSAGCNSTGWTFVQDLLGNGITSVGFATLTAGVPYYFYLDPEGTGGGTVIWQINCATAAFDPCANILASNICGINNTTTVASGTGAWAFGPFVPPGKESLYTFTPTTTGNYTITQNTSTTGTWTDYFFKPVSGGCNNTGWTFVQDLLGNGITSNGFPLTAGVPYYILLDIEGTGGGTINWRINCSVPAPPNDNCTAVSPVTLTPGVPQTFTGNTIGATNTGDGSFTAFPTVWHAFTITQCSDITVNYCATSPAFGDVWINLATSCPAFTFTAIANSFTQTCPGGGSNWILTYLNMPAGTYWLPVLGSEPGFVTPGPYSVNVTANPCPPPPPNDMCAGAIPVTCGSITTGNTNAATNDVGIPCGSTNKGLWYSLTLPTSGIVTLSTCGAGTTYDSWLSIYSGTCGALTCIATNDDFCGLQSQITTAPLAAGTYYILVSGFGTSSGPFSLNVTCALCAVTPVGGTITGTPSGCTNSVLAYSGTGASSYQWQVSTVSAAGPFTDIAGQNSSTLNYTTGAAGTIFIRNAATGAGCAPSFSNVITTTVLSSGGVLNTTGTPSTGCIGSTINLTGGFSAGNASLTITVSGTGFLDMVSWNIKNSANVIIFSGGPYGFGSTNTVTVTPLASAYPVTFFIETQGVFLDNTANYSVVCNVGPTTLLTGTIGPGLTFTSGGLNCVGSSGTVTNPVWTGPNGFSFNGIVAPLLVAGNSGGVYNLAAISPTGCPVNTNVTITALPVPVPSAFSNSPVCENQDVLLFAFDGSSYSWTGPMGYSSSGPIGDAYVFAAQQVNAGTYTITVTGANGCTASESIDIVVNDNPEPFLSLMNEVSCTGFSDGSFQVGVNGGTPFFSFSELSQGQNFTGFYSGLPDGVYYVEVTDINQCVSVAPVEVIVTTVPNAAPVISCIPDITVTNTPGLCGAIVNFTAPAGTDVCPIIGTSQVAGLPSGWTYPVGTTVNTFRVTDVEGLFAECSFSVTVTEDEAPTVVNCPANFSACNPISWTPPVITDNCPGIQVTSTHIPGTNFPFGTTTVTYTGVDVYNNANTCSFDVTRLEESVAATGILSNRDYHNICVGESIVLTIDGGSLGEQGIWKWYSGSCGGTALTAFNGMTSITVSPTTTTTYFARAEGLCNTTACASVTVVVSTTGPPNGLAIIAAPPFGAAGVTGTVSCTPVPGATFYRWTSILGHINAIWFGNPPAAGPVETTVPSVDVQFNQSLQNYQIRVVAGNACGRTNNAAAHIRGTVPAATCLVGPALACPSTTATYSVATCEIEGTNGYQWTVTPNMTITAGQGTHTITVSFGPGFTNGQVCVNGVSQFGLGGPQTCLNVSNNTAAPGPISGNDQPCQSGFETYTIAAVPGATSYVWSTTGISGAIAGGTTTSGTVQFPAGPFSGQVCVQAVSSCGISTATCFNVTSGAAGNPGPILGSVSGVCGATVNYALGTNDANSYNWILPAGVTLMSANGSNAVQVAFPSTPGQHIITVEAFYDCGSTPVSITVDGAPGAITVTPLTICAGSDETYIASATGADTYNWVTSGALYESCTNPSCSNFYVIWDVLNAGFTVEAVNACGTSPAFSLSQNCRISDSGAMETKVYPNPTTGQLTVEFNSEIGGAYNMTVTDMSGRNVYSEDLKATSGMNQRMIDLSSVNTGLYMLYLRDSASGKISVIKVTVE